MEQRASESSEAQAVQLPAKTGNAASYHRVDDNRPHGASVAEPENVAHPLQEPNLSILSPRRSEEQVDYGDGEDEIYDNIDVPRVEEIGAAVEENVDVQNEPVSSSPQVIDL